MKRVLGIFRAACFSPGMVERDEAILRAVMTRLEERGYAVTIIHEEVLTSDIPMPDMVLHMTRSPQALEILQGWEEDGCLIINSVKGIHNVERAALAIQCATLGIPTPKSWIVDTLHNDYLMECTTSGELEAITFPCWIKRAGSCAQEPDDVCCVRDANEYMQQLSHFNKRGIDKVVVMEHLSGDCIKFYAVQGTGFFYCLPSASLGYDKFSNNPHTSVKDRLTCDEKTIKLLRGDFCIETDKLQLDVYGGDIIIDTDGTPRLIDLNDWPSFSVCREEAADAIASLVTKRL